MKGENGAVTVVAAVMVGLISVLMAVLGGLAQVVVARDTAQMAADAAALAAAPVTFRPFGATGSATDEARRFAESNGGELTNCTGCGTDPSWESRVIEVEVSVEIDLLWFGTTSINAYSAAEFVPVQLLGAPWEDR